MTRTTQLALSTVVAMALAAPGWAAAQAVPRTSAGSSGSSSSGSSGSSGGSAGSSSGPSQAQSRSAPSGSRTGSVAQPRSGSSVGSTAGTRSRVGGSGSGGARLNDNAPAIGRYRNGQPIQGTAVPRQPGNYPVHPIYPVYPGYWYPWYGPGFGYGYGWGYYDPWWYGGYPWGVWGYGGYSGGYSGGGGGYEGGESTREDIGSIRLKANVSDAKVYVDGALMGTVDDFDGLGHHLDLAAGKHDLELRADGYQTYTSTVDVLSGKTTTERVTLKKK